MDYGNMITSRTKKLWRKNNPHNETILEYCRNISLNQISVGFKTYGPLNIIGFGQKEERLTIGSFCSIAREVAFLLGGEHDYQLFSTFPFRNKFLGENEAISKGPIIIEDDVWIGYRATILSGVKVGQGAVIAAGSTITWNVPPYAIADSFHIIKFRFDEETIRKLLCFNYASLKEQDFFEYQDLFSNHDLKNNFFQSKLYHTHLKEETNEKL